MVTWSNKWISNNESIYSIIRKYKIANVLESDYIKRTFYLPLNPTFHEFKDLQAIIPQNFNFSLFSKQLNLDLVTYFLKQLSLWGISNINPLILNDLISTQFRYCFACIENGYHSNLHQFHYFNYCPFHNSNKLIETCGKCGLKLSLNSKLFETDIDQCTCGFNYERFNYWAMKRKWITTSVDTFYDSILFPVKEYIVIDKPVKNPYGYSINVNLTKIKYEYIIKNTTKSSIQKDPEVVTSIYKSLLRKIRRKCKTKCHKTYFKKGDRATLCIHCTAYIKLRRQYENITNEWDLFFNNATMISGLKQLTFWSPHFINGFSEWVSPIKLTEIALLNILSYMLYHSLINEHQKWLVFGREKNYNTEFNLTFVLENTDRSTIKLKIY